MGNADERVVAGAISAVGGADVAPSSTTAGKDNSLGSSRPRLILPPVWADRLEQSKCRREQQVEPDRIIPRSANFYVGQLTVVTEAKAACDLVELAHQRPLVCVGIDFEFRHARPGVWMRRYMGKDQFWYDPRSYVPLLLAVVLAE